MKTQLLILMLFFILLLSAQTDFQVQYVTTSTLPETYVGNAVQSDGSLFLFGINIGQSDITINRTSCSQEGIISPSQTVITYYNPIPWSTNIPVFYSYSNKYSFTYLILKNTTHIFVFKIPDISINTIPIVGVFENYGLWNYSDPGHMFHVVHGVNQIYYKSTPDRLVHTIDLALNSQYATQYQTGLNRLGNDYLLLDWYENNIHHHQLIDENGNATNVVLTGAPFGWTDQTSPDIGGGIYIACWSEGFDNTYVGYLELQNNIINVHSLGQSMMIEIPYPFNVVPLTYQRFLCHKSNLMGASSFHTYELINGDYAEYTGFPNLNTPEFADNAKRLFRMDDRFVVAVSYTINSTRLFHCIDLQNQTIVTTAFLISNGTTEFNYKVSSGSGNIYYTRQGEVIIFKILPDTGNQDYSAIPSDRITISPNPFSNTTRIKLPNDSFKHVTLSIFNQKGQLIRTFTANKLSEGNQTFIWDGQDSKGKQVKAGLYFLKYMGNKSVMTRKLIKF